MNWLYLLYQLPLAYILFDELYLLLQRKKISQASGHGRLYQVSAYRLKERRLCIFLLVILSFFRNSSAFGALYTGAYIGFVTNALVTVLILHVFIPILQGSIAETAREQISDLVELGEGGDAIPNSVMLGVILLGALSPGGIITIALGGLVSWLTRGKVKEKIRDMKEAGLEDAKKQIERSIKAMSKREISNMMDEIIGKILVLIEAAGFVTGAIFAILPELFL